jgi:coproporphyrinogen III oxidase
MSAVDRTAVEAWFRGLQERLCAVFEGLDGASRFGSDNWQRDGGGGGDTRVLRDGAVLEKAAVNFSAVEGATPRRISEEMVAAGPTFYATGVSVIVHPRNPHAPTFHANLRYFESGAGSWFGGGSDLTPHYLYDEDAAHFHRVLRLVCDRHPVADYRAWKEECDRYFFLPHRGEARGVGGLFFDHLTERLDEVWSFQMDLGDHLAEAYAPIVERRRDAAYGARERRWQEIRRGRYVEFNLVWDRGTRFGLETGGRVESVLASLPPAARWDYGFEPGEGTSEESLLAVLRSPARDWAPDGEGS